MHILIYPRGGKLNQNTWQIPIVYLLLSTTQSTSVLTAALSLTTTTRTEARQGFMITKTEAVKDVKNNIVYNWAGHHGYHSKLTAT